MILVLRASSTTWCKVKMSQASTWWQMILKSLLLALLYMAANFKGTLSVSILKSVYMSRASMSSTSRQECAAQLADPARSISSNSCRVASYGPALQMARIMIPLKRK